MNRFHLVGALAFVAIAASPGEGLAQESEAYPPCTKEVTRSDVAAAKGLFQAGQASYQESDYSKAASYWQDAYQRDCTAHALLLNLSRAYELSGERKKAVVALRTYLEREPDSPQKEQLTRRVEKLEARVAEDEKKAAAAAPPKQEPSAPDPSQPPPPMVEVDAEEEPDGGTFSPVPLIVAGVGVVVAATGGVLHLTSIGTVTDLEDRCGGSRDCPVGGTDVNGDVITQADLDDANSARSLANVGTGLFIGGLAVTVAGVVWHFVQPLGFLGAQAEPPTKARGFTADLTPAVGPDYTGLSLSGTF